MQRPLLRVYPFFLILLLIVGMALPIFAQESPTPLNPDEALVGTFDANNSADVYGFQANAGSTVSLLATSDDLPLGLLLSDTSGNVLAEIAASESGVFNLPDFEVSQTGTYFVTVFTAPQSEGSYELTLTISGGEEAVATDLPAQNSEIVTQLPPNNDVLLNNGMEVRLQWTENVDLNLEVRDPDGNTLYFDNRVSNIGGSFGFDANGFCEVISNAPTETASWQPGFVPTGSYEILVFYRQSCLDTAQAVPFSLTVTVNGTVLDVIEATIAPPPTVNSNSVYLANFVIVNETSATINDGGAYPDTALNQLPAPFADLTTSAQAVERDVPITGAIFEEQDYVVYAVEATEGENLSVSMTASSRNLDTLLQLIDPNGNLLAVNDDTTNSTNSLIQNARILQTGTYYVVATRYGKDLGGTEGEFSLVISESTASLPDNLASLALPEGDIQVYLTWNNNVDLQLLVRDPVGQSVFDDRPQITSGGVLAADGNVNCIQEEGDPVSYIYWPSGLGRPGSYEVDVWFENTCEDNTPVIFTLTIVVNGQVVLVERQSPVIASHFVTNFSFNPDGTVNMGQAGFTNNGVTLDLFENEERLPISFNTPVSGAITPDNPFDVYTFSGEAGQIVTITMQRLSGSNLDTNLYLLSSVGVTLQNNDDAPAGSVIGINSTDRVTDSLISAVTLPTTGEYLIVATRFGNQFGGTVGAYQLTVQLNQ